jgi:GNAT superfamily N-acetyltransferase
MRNGTLSCAHGLGCFALAIEHFRLSLEYQTVPPRATTESMSELVIRNIEDGDFVSWNRVWQDYCTFYKVSLPEGVTQRTWNNLVNADKPVIYGFVAEIDARVVGLAHAIEHENTWQMSPVVYLEDLAVDPAFQGRGIGRKLMQRVIDDAKRRGCSRVYWMTQKSNQTARRLYDSFTPVDDEYVRYMLKLSELNAD